MPAAGPPTLAALAASVDAILGTASGRTEVARARAGDAPVRHLGLALDPWPGLRAWVAAESLDAVLLHRHWRLGLDGWLPAVGVLANHDPFDRRLGFGHPPELLAALQVTADATLGERDGFPLGVVGTGPARTPAALRGALAALFGAVEAELAPAAAGDAAPDLARLAVARAMTPALVRHAAALGARAYVTGQLRQPARDAARDAGLHVFAVGHHRAERWALGLLADALRAAWPGLVVRTPP
jgi:putative NIF3 family GTP cyclohydrolase 1 type 2